VLAYPWTELAVEMNESGSGKAYSAPLIRTKILILHNILKSWSMSYLVVGHSPDWIWWKAGVQGPCVHHDRWKEGLCDGPWWGNTGPEWPQGQYQSHCLQPDNRVIKLAVNYWTNPVMHHRSQKCQRTSGHTWHLPKHIR